jgi:FkbM family methyltransferase
MKFIDFISKCELALIRRLPFNVGRIFVPSLSQKMAVPEQASSVFNDIFVHDYYRPICPLPKQATVVDLGSNQGLFIIYINKMIHGGTIYGFEANPNAMACLTYNIENIKYNDNKIEIHNKAVSSYNGTIRFLTDVKNKTNVACTAVLDISHFSDADNFQPVDVPCVKLSDIITERIDYLKCDIEGAEYDVLDEVLLTPAVTSQVVCEFHDIVGRRVRLLSIIESALDNGYRIFSADCQAFADKVSFRSWIDRQPSTTIVLKFCAEALISDPSHTALR